MTGMTQTTRNVGDLAKIAQDLLGPKVFAASADPRRSVDGLLPPERATLPRMVAKRRQEFTAGRLAARAAMRAMGLGAQPVLMGEDRAPVWPQGIVGSISHNDSSCLAVVARNSDVAALGLDIEENQPLPEGVSNKICRAEELHWLQTPAARTVENAETLIFSAKECAYKCQYPISKTIFGFDTLSIEIDPVQNQFSARFTKDVAPFAAGQTLNGAYFITQTTILTVMALPNPVVTQLQMPQAGRS